jgi:riboflavin transporter FmnP
MKNNLKSTNVMVKISMLAGIAAVLMYLSFPILPAFNWLEIDFSDLPALIGAFAYGPLVGVIIETIKILIKFLIKPSVTAGIGELANLIIGISFIIPVGLIYKRNRTRKTAVFGLITGTISMAVFGLLANFFIMIPLYSKFMPQLKESAYLTNYIFYGVLPFNLIKGAVVSAVTILIYKKVSNLILKENIKTRVNA